MKKLAILGGDQAVSRPVNTRHAMGAEEKAAVDALFDAAIASGQNIGYNGPEEEALCKEFSAFLGGGYADGVNGGTMAVYVALRAINPQPFTEIIVSAVTDPGGMMPIVMCNCIPVVADAAPGQYNTSAAEIERCITPLTSAILVAHIAGEPADMPAIMALAKKHGIPVIEDCAQAHGASIHGQYVGTFGDVSAFSTMFGKHFNTGGQGGMVFTKDESLYWKILQAADRGKPFGLPAGSTNCIGALNCNLSELGAAIGRVQLRKLPRFVEGRRQVVAKLTKGFAEIPSVHIPALLPDVVCSYWFWRLGVNLDGLSCSKEDYVAALAAEGVPLNPSYRGALPHTQSWFVNRHVFGDSQLPWSSPEYKGDASRTFPTPNAQAVMDTQYNLSIHESWTDEDIALVLEAYRKVDAWYRR